MVRAAVTSVTPAGRMVSVTIPVGNMTSIGSSASRISRCGSLLSGGSSSSSSSGCSCFMQTHLLVAGQQRAGHSLQQQVQFGRVVGHVHQHGTFQHQQVRCKHLLTRNGKRQHARFGSCHVRGRYYYPFHKMIGKSANWHKYKERYIAPRKMEMEMRLVYSTFADYRDIRDSRSWHWKLPKALADATTATEVLDAFLRFRHKHPKHVYHYLWALTRLVRVGGCDPADWRFKYITSRLEPLYWKVTNLPRLALLYGKIGSRSDLKKLSKLMLANIEKYSLGQLIFIAKAHGYCKLQDAEVFNQIAQSVIWHLDYAKLVKTRNYDEFSSATNKSVTSVNVDGLLVPQGAKTLAKIRKGPNFWHPAYKGMVKYKYWRRQGIPYDIEQIKDYVKPRRVDSISIGPDSNIREALVDENLNGNSKLIDSGKNKKNLDDGSDEFGYTSFRLNAAAQEEVDTESEKNYAAPDDHRYDVTEITLDQLVSIVESFAICEYKNYTFLQRMVQEFMVRSYDTELNPNHLTLLSRFTLALTKLKFRDYGFMDFTSNMLQKRLVMNVESDFPLHEVAQKKRLLEDIQFESGKMSNRKSRSSAARQGDVGGDEEWAFDDENLDEWGGPQDTSKLSLKSAAEQKKKKLAKKAERSADSASRNSNSNDGLDGTHSSSQDLLNVADGDFEYNPVHILNTNFRSYMTKMQLSAESLLGILRCFQKQRVHDVDLFMCALKHIDKYSYSYTARELTYLAYVISRVVLVPSISVDGSKAGDERLMNLSDNAADRSVREIYDCISKVIMRELSTLDLSCCAAAAGFFVSTKENPEEYVVKLAAHVLNSSLYYETREKYEIGKLFELFSLYTPDWKKNKKLPNLLCKHIHRHLQYLEPKDFLRVGNALQTTDFCDIRVYAAIGRWAKKRRVEFSDTDWTRLESMLEECHKKTSLEA